MLSELYNIKPFKQYVFLPLAVLPSMLIITVAVAAYVFMASQNIDFQRQDLKGIASRTAAFIPKDIHERLQQSDSSQNEDYDLLHLYLQSVMAGNDDIDDIYTLVPNEDQTAFTYVVSGAETQDRDGDHVIDAWEQQKPFGGKFDTTAYPLIFKAMSGPVVDEKIKYRSGQSSLTAFAPLRTTEGAVIGVLGVDYAADSLATQRHILLRRIAAVAGLVVILSIGAAWWITRQITKPILVLINALDRVRSGDYAHEIPDAGRLEQRIVARLFNTNKEIMMAAGVARQQDQLAQGSDQNDKRLKKSSDKG